MPLLTTAPTVSITLPIGVLQDLRIRQLAQAALLRLSIHRERNYWASEEGRIRMNGYDCGQQDRVSDRLESEERQADAFAANAETIANTLRAAGYYVVEASTCSLSGTIVSLCENVDYYVREVKDGTNRTTNWLTTELTDCLARLDHTP